MVERRHRPVFGVAFALASAFLVLQGCGGGNPDAEVIFRASPDFVREAKLSTGMEPRTPLSLQIHRDTLYVSHPKTPRIDCYSVDLAFLGSISLEDPEPVHPTSFYVTESWIIVSDMEKRLVIVYERDGTVHSSFGRLPDDRSQLSPRSLAIHGGVLYLADLGLGRVLAISLADAAGITEFGELILTIPSDREDPLGLPAGLHVTADGRVLVGDIQSGAIEVFTCDGRSIYSFDLPDAPNRVGAVAFACDDHRDPSLIDENQFDPSGVGNVGRIHVVDVHNGRIHVFNPLGNYLMSYPEPGVLSGPSDIAIDHKSQRIFVADPVRKSLFVYRYHGGVDG